MITSLEIAWAAGFLEGEGTFGCRGKTTLIAATQVQREPLERLHAIFGGKIYTFEQQDRSRRMTFHRWDLYHQQARGLMMTIFGLMSPRRRQQIVKALTPWRSTQVAAQHRTHCPLGHPYDEANTYINRNGSRRCRLCASVSARRAYLKGRAL